MIFKKPVVPVVVDEDKKDLEKLLNGKTEEEVISQTGPIVILGDEEIELKPLTIKQNRIWSARYIDVLNTINKALMEEKKEGLTQDEKIISAKSNLETMYSKFPDLMISLLWAYLGYDKEKIEEMEDKVTTAQANRAVMKAIEVGIGPLVRMVASVMPQGE